jgi:hypothetical protein
VRQCDKERRQKKKEGRRGCNELVSVLRPADFLVRQADNQRGANIIGHERQLYLQHLRLKIGR